ncbi:MAG: hypothetical protein JW969_10280 [Spirochaetales bacterium]|nr:hypothetical protein [Spirochaetales bacterium]
MSDLEKRIIGDWVDIKNSLKDSFTLWDYFKKTDLSLEHAISNIKLSVEEGVLEYKKSWMIKVFRFLDEAKFKTFDFEDIAEHKRTMDEILFIVLIQRLVSIGTIRINKGDGGSAILSADDIEINTILKDILGRIKDDPELKKNLAVKNILVQFSIYHNERETMKKLSPNIKAGSRSSSSFYENFKTTFDRIFANIRKHYRTFLEEEAKKDKKLSLLALFPLDKLASVIFNQAKELTRIYSTFRFVLTEKYKPREVLVHLSARKDPSMKLFENEKQVYETFSKEYNPENPGPVYSEIITGLTREIAGILEKFLNNT